MGICLSAPESDLDCEGIIKIDDIRRDFTHFHLLGDGGSSNVFSVVRRSDKQEFALKKMSKRNEMTKSLFSAEANILQNLSHPHIIGYESTYMDEKNYYIVTQLCKGGDLLAHIKKKYGGALKSKFTEAFVASLIVQIIEAVGYCHSQNIVHRDIKPENFVFMEHHNTERIVLIDFGIAKRVVPGKSYSDLVGTPYYIAPEYLTKTERTTEELKASDVWSIGIVTYVLGTGRPPFHGNTNEEVFRKVISKPLKFPRKAKLSYAGKYFLKKILKKNAHERPTAEELKSSPWLLGDAADEDLDVVDGLKSFDLKNKMRRVIKRVVKDNIQGAHEDLSAMFSNIDKNGDGLLDQDELTHFLLSQGYGKHNAPSKAAEIMEKLDVDKDGELNIEEFEAAWVDFQLSEDEKIVASLFDCFDENGDGRIDASELKNIIGDDAADMQKIFKLFDDDGNGEVSYDEFAKALQEIGFINNNKDDAGIKGLFSLEMDDVQLDFDEGDEEKNAEQIEITDEIESNILKAQNAGIDDM